MATLNVPVLWLPLAALLPVQSPLAVQELGLLVALQVMLALSPTLAEIGDTLIDTTGTGADVTFSGTLFANPVPPALVQLRL